MTKPSIDLAASQRLLSSLGKANNSQSQSAGTPASGNDVRILDTRNELAIPIGKTEIAYLKSVTPWLDMDKLLNRLAPKGILNREALEELGLELLPLASFGLLNGGAATSYVDTSRNKEVFPGYFETVKSLFELHGSHLVGKPKALAPAFYFKDSSAGPNFLELKLNSIQKLLRRYKKSSCPERTSGAKLQPLLPWVQLVSEAGRAPISNFCKEWASKQDYTDPYISELSQPLEGVQNLVAAFADSTPGLAPQFFKDSKGELLGLPGGHGQAYHCMQEVFTKLRKLGKKYVWLGNIDNIGFLPNSLHLALTVLKGANASFEFSYKTALDTKGGILVENPQEKLSCADIGQSISRQEVEAAELSGKPILFNCASGLFSIDYLLDNYTYIMENLPLRPTKNKKDIGTYIAVEQSAWEILGLLEKPLILAVDKSLRFIANKFLLDGFLASGLGDCRTLESLDQSDIEQIQTALASLLKKEYDYEIDAGGVLPKKSL